MTSKLKHILLATSLLWIAAGCSTTKRLGEEDVLYTGVKKIHIEDADGEKLPSSAEADVKSPMNVKPNNPLFSPYVRTPIPTGLWAWNYLYTEKTKGFRAWLYRNLAKQPVLISDLKLDQRTDLISNILDNHGYFGSSVSYEVLQKKNPKKARVSYYVTAGRPWYYGSVEFPDIKCDITRKIDSLQPTSNIKTGDQYNIDTLTRERIRITNSLREQSYYYFRPDYLHYLADTVRERYSVDMRMILSDGIPEAALNPYDVGSLTLRFFSSTGGKADSTIRDDIKIWYEKPLKLRRKVLSRMVTIRLQEAVRISDINKTLNNMTDLGIFRYVNLSVTPLDSLSASDTKLDMTITAAFDAPLDAEFEVDFASKSNSFIGPGATFGVRHKNFLKGGEVFSVKLNGSYEWQTGNTSSGANGSSINSYEFGLNTSLTFPRLLVPRFVPQSGKYPSRTVLSLGASVLNRPKFFTMLSVNFSNSFDFQTSPTSFHSVSILKLTYTDLFRTTGDFDEVLQQNPAIAESFRNQFIPSASYTYTLDRSSGKRSRMFWQSTFTTAGNILSAVGDIFGESEPKKIFGRQYSQFIKGTTEFRRYQPIGEKGTFAIRAILGVGYAYGNSEVLPYSEQFYIGGANSIRAFTVRSIGPGTYRADENETYGYFDQTGDIKFEANAEYRFGIISNLSGAVFVDVGNIWLLKKDPERPGGEFTFKKLYKNLALGTGIGLRYDISYLVIRADLGIGIHVPYQTSKSGYYNIPRFKDGLGLHLAIGYPF